MLSKTFKSFYNYQFIFNASVFLKSLQFFLKDFVDF